MLIHKVVKGFVILKNRDDKYDPPTVVSNNWKHWKATWDIKTCEQCKEEHGKIYTVNDQPNPEPPLHPNCRCVVEAMDAVAVGVATKDGDKGADWWLRNYGVLPSNYIKEADLRVLGWDRGDSPQSIFRARWLQWVNTETRMVICHKLQVEFGTRLTSIIIAAKEMDTEF